MSKYRNAYRFKNKYNKESFNVRSVERDDLGDRNNRNDRNDRNDRSEYGDNRAYGDNIGSGDNRGYRYSGNGGEGREGRDGRDARDVRDARDSAGRGNYRESRGDFGGRSYRSESAGRENRSDNGGNGNNGSNESSASSVGIAGIVGNVSNGSTGCNGINVANTSNDGAGINSGNGINADKGNCLEHRDLDDSEDRRNRRDYRDYRDNRDHRDHKDHRDHRDYRGHRDYRDHRDRGDHSIRGDRNDHYDNTVKRDDRSIRNRSGKRNENYYGKEGHVNNSGTVDNDLQNNQKESPKLNPTSSNSLPKPHPSPPNNRPFNGTTSPNTNTNLNKNTNTNVNTNTNTNPTSNTNPASTHNSSGPKDKKNNNTNNYNEVVCNDQKNNKWYDADEREPEKLIQIKTGNKSEIDETYDNNKIKSFEDLNLKDQLLRGIYEYGFEIPSPIQQKCVPIIAQKKDLIAQSQSGTGKTGAFVAGILQVINENNRYPQAIILAPTRELSIQIESVTNDLGKRLKIKTVICVGGNNVDDNMREAVDAHVLIGTPGRIYDIISRNVFDIDKIDIFCMDEADELLKREFIEQTRSIIRSLRHDTQICAFSATLADDTSKIAAQIMNNPVKILVPHEELNLDLILQYYVDVEEDKHKLLTLEDLYCNFSIGQCIIYVNYKDKGMCLKESLTEKGHSVEAIHSGLSPVEREHIMKQFRSGNCRVLISTDLLSRGIDVQQVGYVINYDLPNETNCDSYLHRIGRSGRYGKKGVAINFVTRKTRYILKSIMSRYKINISKMPDPAFVNEYLQS